MQKKWEEAEIRKIYEEDYLGKHIGTTTLSKKYNVYIYDQFKKYGLELRNDVEKSKKYYCNSNFFEQLNTEEKAYWYGFILGDGYISTSSKSTKKVGIALQDGDFKHLVKFNEAIQSTYPIHHYECKSGYKINTKYCRVTIVDNTLANDLIRHGCVEHKTNIAKPPYTLDFFLRRHFIRGYFDANGSIAITRGKENHIDTYEIKFAGTDDILLWIMNHLIEEKIIHKIYPLYKRKDYQIVSAFDFGGNNLCLKFLEYIYKDATVWLERKYQRYVNLKKIVEERDAKKMVKVCSYCGITKSSQFLIWHEDGEYKDKVFCTKHIQQLRKYKRIIPDIKSYCEICGDSKSHLSKVGNKFPEYHGITMCKRHYEQICKYGKITNPAKGRHKNEQ